MTEPLLKEREVARYLAVSVNALYTWRRLGKGPKFLKLGSSLAERRSTVRYRREDLEGCLGAQPQGGAR